MAKLDRFAAILSGTLLLSAVSFAQGGFGPEALGSPQNPQNAATVQMQQQGQPRQGQNQRRRFMAFVRQLNLSADQQTQFKSLMQNQRRQFTALKQDASLSSEQKKEQARQIQKQVRQQFLAMLTPGQQKQMMAMMQASRERQKQQSPERTSQPPNADDSNGEGTATPQPSQQQLDQILASFVSDDDATPAQKTNLTKAARKTGSDE